MKVIFLSIFLLSLSLREGSGEDISGNKMLVDIDNSPILSFEYKQNNAWFVSRNNQNLYFTKNGGDDWQEVSGNSVNGFRKVYFLDKSKGWAFCGENSVWETNDGGQTWKYLGRLRDSGSKGIIAQRMKFISIKLGWLIDTAGRLWHTNNGGRTWSVKSIWRIYNVELFGLHLINEKEGWLACDKGLALKTIDGGTTWKSIQLPSPASIYNIQFINEKEGWALIGKNVFHTANGGESWKAQLFFNSFFEGPILNSIFFLDAKIGWAVGSTNPYSEKQTSPVRIRGAVYQTLDGGNNWKIEERNIFDEEVFDIRFSNQKQGWLVTSKKIYRTDDEGRTWKITFQFP